MLTSDKVEIEKFVKEVEEEYGPAVSERVDSLIRNHSNRVVLPDVLLQQVLTEMNHDSIVSLNSSLKMRFRT